MASILQSLHQETAAEFQAYDELEIVSTFGNVPAEYSAIHKSACKMDRPQRGILEATGRDRLDFLNRMLTNQTYDKQDKKPMPAGSGVYAFLLNVKGRIAADMNVLELGDRAWLEMDARLIEPTRLALEKYLITDDVKLTNRSESLHEIALYGPKAMELLTRLAAPLGSGEPGRTAGRVLAPDLPLSSTPLTLAGIEITAFRDDPCGVPGIHLVVPAEEAARIWTALEMRPIGWAAFNAARIESGRPLMGIDFDQTVLPAETGPATLARAVSFTKGCYLGQEIVARMHARGIVARQLVGIRMNDDALPVAGTPVYDHQTNAVGGITSSTVSPILSNAAICLGLVKKAFLEIGTELIIPAEGAMHKGKIAALPFVGTY